MLRLAEQVRALTGVNIFACYQCGKCSAGCPMGSIMDVLPSGLIRLVQLNDPSVLECSAIWQCSACYACTQRCPRGVDVAAVLEALRQLRLRARIEALDYRRVPHLSQLPTIALVAASRKLTA